MDLSTLELPLRSQRKTDGLFHLRPPLSSVNVCYETAEAANAPPDQAPSQDSASKQSTPAPPAPELTIDRASDDSDADHDAPAPKDLGGGSPAPGETAAGANSAGADGASAGSAGEADAGEAATDQDGAVPGSAGADGLPTSPQPSPPKPFPVKVKSPSHQSLRSLTRASFSGTASDECQQFIKSLKEPRYAKPLSADEISWLFQDFYRKLHQDLLGESEEGKELLSVAEQETQRQQLHQIDSVIDRAERAVAGGELYTKLFALGGSHDTKLQARICTLREHPALIDLLVQKLELDPAITNELTAAKTYLNRLNRETAPKAKLQAIIKAHQALVDATDASGSADTLFPVFVLALATSEAEDWWKTFLFIQRFRRASSLSGQAAYCLTNLEAAIHFVEQLTFDEHDLPDGVDSQVFAKPIANPRTPRDRSGSQSSRGSVATTSSATGSFGQRIGETLSSYRNILVTARRPSLMQPPAIDQRFINTDPDSLTLADVRALLREYRKLAEYVERPRQ